MKKMRNELTAKVLKTVVAETEHPTNDDFTMYAARVTFRIERNGKKLMDVTLAGNDSMTPEGARIEVLRLLQVAETFEHLAAINVPVSRTDINKTLEAAGQNSKWLTEDEIRERRSRRLCEDFKRTTATTKRLMEKLKQMNEKLEEIMCEMGGNDNAIF